MESAASALGPDVSFLFAVAMTGHALFTEGLLMLRVESSFLSALVGLAVVAAASPAAGDVTGFNNLVGWQYNESDNGSPPVIINSDHIQFTTGPNQRRSLWHTTPQDITEFVATFTYRAGSIGASGNRQGVTFTMHNNPAGVLTIGSPVGGLFGNSGLGYVGIGTSAAVTIETDTGPALTYNGYYTNGVIGGGSVATTPVNAFSFNEIDVTIAYSGSIMSVTMVEGANVFGPQNYLVGDLSSVLGGSTAYIGFTTSTANGGSNQFLSNFQFSAIPEPGTLSLLAIAGIGLIRSRRMA